MSTKVKVIIIISVVLIEVLLVVGLFIYINHLNNKISDLEVLNAEQSNEIKTLQSNVDSLSKNIDVYHNTLNTISDYIDSIEKLKSDDSAVKQAIYEEVLSNPESMEWFNEKLPDNIISIINDRAADGMCNN